jgi:Ricin-type beta-trefoil lectin domain
MQPGPNAALFGKRFNRSRSGSRFGKYVLVSGFCFFTAGAALWTVGSSSAATGYKKIVNADIHQLCMDVKAEDNYNAPGARAQQWTCTGVPEQQWLRTYVGDRYNVPDLYTIRAERSAMCLDEVDGISAFTGKPSSDPAGVQIRQYPCNGAQSQNWIFKSTGEVVNQVSGLCLDTTSPSKGSMIMQWTCNGNTAQRWFW